MALKDLVFFKVVTFNKFYFYECNGIYRNQILSIWSRDVTRILPLSDCGVSDTPSEDEPPRSSLIREVYAFLDQCVSSLLMLLSYQFHFFLLLENVAVYK